MWGTIKGWLLNLKQVVSRLYSPTVVRVYKCPFCADPGSTWGPADVGTLEYWVRGARTVKVVCPWFRRTVGGPRCQSPAQERGAWRCHVWEG